MVWWTLANVLGLLAGYWLGPMICDGLFMSQCPPASPNDSVDCYIWNPISWMVIIGGTVGIFVGMAEWLVLRKNISRCKWWVIATMLGWAIGLGTLAASREVLGQRIENLAIEALYGATAGLVVGVAQWLILRRIVHKAGWWLAAMLLSGFLTFWLYFPGATSFVNFWQFVLSGTVTGIITAIALIWLFKQPLARPELVTSRHLSSLFLLLWFALVVCLGLLSCAATPEPTATSVARAAATSTRTTTPSPTASATSTRTPTTTPTMTSSPTSTPTPSSTPMPSPTLTLTPTCPLKDLPLDLGNTWVYTSISYAGYDTQTITMTGTSTDTVVEVQWQPPFFAAKVVHEYGPDQIPDDIEENQWADWLPLDEWTDSSWYVISGTHVYVDYKASKPDFAKLKTESAAHETGPLYAFPLSEGDCWDPAFGKPVETQDCWERPALREVVERLESSQRTDDAGTWAITVTYSTMTQDYYQAFDAQIELDDCATDDCECFLLITWYNNGGDNEWFCPGIGMVGGYWNHAGTPFGDLRYLVDYTLQGSVSSTSTPTLTPTVTPTPPQSPLVDFPLNLGNTWVYSYSEYATIFMEEVSTTIRAGYLVTETIVETRMEFPFFAAKMREERRMIAPPANLAEDNWPEWLLKDAEKTEYHYWRVISGTQVYSWGSPEADRGPNLSTFKPSKEILEFVFPLSPNAGWYPAPWDREEPLEDWLPGFRGVLDVSELETAPDGTRYSLLHITRYKREDYYDSTERVDFLNNPADALDSCFLLAEAGGGPPGWEWFCPGVGIAGGYYHHGGLDPFGDESILIDYTLQGSVPAAPTPTPAATLIPPQCPLADLPLNLGNTWIYSSTQYDCIGDCGSDNPQIVTGTFVVTATVVDTRFQAPYFAAEMAWESKAITLSDSLEGEDLGHLFHLHDGEPWSYWYIVSDTNVYERWHGLDLASFRPYTETLAFVFPLEKTEHWYRYPDDRAKYPDYKEPFTRTDIWPSSVIIGSRELSLFNQHLDDCFMLYTYWVNGPEIEYFCPGIGIVGGFYDHMGTPFGHRTRLIDYSFGSTKEGG